MKFRKKSVVIDATQWIGGHPPVEGMEPYSKYGDDPKHRGKYIIMTLEGMHFVNSGDWIITGIKGEKYPCKPDIFEMTYEKVEE